MFGELNDRSFKLFATKYYSNPSCSDIAEFEEDVSRFKYLKRLFRRYHDDNDLKERLILNHLIIIYNVFGVENANRLVKFKIDKSHYPALKTFLIFLNFLDDSDMLDIPVDLNVAKRLREL